MRILALSDKVIPFIYSPQARQRFAGIDIIIGCGDLPYYYLEYVLTVLDIPLYYVRGNHDFAQENSPEGHQRSSPNGGADLHGCVINHQGLLLAGVQGSLRYREGEFQYTQAEMWLQVLRIVPAVLRNRLVYGRYLDIFVTHAPPAGIHDQADLPHKGIKAFLWLIKVFRPAYHLHGHVHIFRPDTPVRMLYHQTQVVNVYGFQEIQLTSGMPVHHAVRL